jgi:protein-S-isoprenylcysteine O-methyltransferase Ste14
VNLLDALDQPHIGGAMLLALLCMGLTLWFSIVLLLWGDIIPGLIGLCIFVMTAVLTYWSWRMIKKRHYES